MDDKIITFAASPEVQAKIEGEQERLQQNLPGSRVSISIAVRSLICMGSTVVAKAAK